MVDQEDSNIPAEEQEESVTVAPQEGGQENYLTRTEIEVLYGGAAGPGKSWALIVDALGLQYIQTDLGRAAVEVPDYRAVIFRRETPQLGKLIDEARKYYCNPPFNAKAISQKKGTPGYTFHFPSGAEIYLCHLENENDKHNHDGFEYQFIGWDELTQFTLTQYLHLFSRARSAIKGLNTRIRSTTNPIGVGLWWVKKRFIKTAGMKLEPGLTYYFRPPEGDPMDNPQGIQCAKDHPFARSRTFIPGYLFENKILMESDPYYMLNIMIMGKKYEQALLHGDWDAFSGDFFEDFDKTKQEIEPFRIPENWPLIASIDPGWASPCSFGMYTKNPEGVAIRLLTYYARGLAPQQHAQNIQEVIKGFSYTRGRIPDKIVVGHDAFAKKEKYTSKESDVTWAEIFSEITGMTLEKAYTDRINGWWNWKGYMRQNKWVFFSMFNDPLIDEMLAAVHDDKVVEDIMGRGNDPNVIDHALDESRYGLNALGSPDLEANVYEPDWAKTQNDLPGGKYTVEGI